MATAEQGFRGEGVLVRVEQQPADLELATRLGITEGDPVVMRLRHMMVERETVQIQEIQESYFPLDLIDGTPLAAPEKMESGTYAALDGIGHGPARVAEEVTARPATDDEQEVLRPGGAKLIVLAVVRTTWDEPGRVVEVLRVAAAADRHVFVYEDLPID
jgi:GntR family transcriptional regulator